MKCLKGMLCILVVFTLISGCSKKVEETQVTEINVSEIESQESIELYSSYNGYWSDGGISHEQILLEGGTELNCMLTEENVFSGTLFTQQGTTERFASIENITGKIENGEMEFEFSDDGWGNSGTLHILFLEDSIIIEVLNYQMSEGNTSGYGISGKYSLVKID